MFIVCLDLEGVLVPEIWVEFAKETGINELKRTTRDEPDYDKLMKYRLNVLKENSMGLKEIQDTISRINPMDGAKNFLDELRSFAQVIIVSDTFYQFAQPLMKKLGYPTIFCNNLIVGDNNQIDDYQMRVENTKYTTVKALQAAGFQTIASGDSYNDLPMIKASKAGFLFRSPEEIRQAYPDIKALETYEELLEEIKKTMNNK
ncbi:bifunctional phosphoserine phosphatase/homoserine phosphotransferase ThrH [Lachnobacterium bovis]